MSLKPANPSRLPETTCNLRQARGYQDPNWKKASSPPAMSLPFQAQEDDGDVSSVEIGRPHANPHLSFQSFDHPSHLDSELFSRHGDEDSLALDHELGLTMSTAAHHASALTLNAGLHGKYGAPRRSRELDAEFDPERPLQPMLNNKVAEGLSIFDTTTRSRSRSLRKNQQPQEPVIVDPSAGLDRYLETGLRPPHTSRGTYPYMSRSHSQPDPGASEAEFDESPPRLSKVLSSHFSPKRPRSAQSLHPSNRPSNPTPSHMAPNLTKSKSSKSHPGPSNLNPIRQERMHAEQENQAVREKPPKVIRSHQSTTEQPKFDPDLDNDKTPRPHRGLFMTSTPTAAQVRRPPFTNIVNKRLEGTKRKQALHSGVHLPDVTGLTSAVGSPIKGGGVGYCLATVGNPSLATDLIAALDNLQNRLQTLEREHSVSRRRVRELELDLEDCKIEAARERTRILNREREMGEHAQRRERERLRQAQEKVQEEEKQRYRQIVEEKKSLQSFVETMRNHMTRLTSEIALHQSLIDGLRADAHAAEEVEAEVQTLRAKVDRLEGEVERLKSFVEDGVRERQRAKDASRIDREDTTTPAQVGIDITYATNPLDREDEVEREASQQAPDLDDQGQVDEDVEEHQYQSEEGEYQPPDSLHGAESDLEYEREPDPPSKSTARVQRFIKDSEVARVEAEMLERRSERSASRSNSTVPDRDNDSGNGSSLREPGVRHSIRQCTPIRWTTGNDAPASTATPLEYRDQPASGHNRSSTRDDHPDIPLPNIHGSRIERLFYSAPEHDANNCPACMRRNVGKNGSREADREVEERLQDVDDLKEYFAAKARSGYGKEKRCHAAYNRTKTDQVHSQTALTRVIRELEDDFTHYKGVYLDLAKQYGIIDPVSNVAKRNVLANHLHWIIDLLERIGDHIAILYQLLNFQDKPLTSGQGESSHYQNLERNEIFA